MTITGSLLVSGSTTQIGNNTLTGNTILSGSINVSGSQTFKGNFDLTGSFNISGSTLQVGNNTLLGNTVLSGSITISSSLAPGNLSASVNIYGDTAVTGFIKLNPYSTNIDTSISASYIYVSGSTNDLYFAQNVNGYANTTRLRWIEGNMYTGLLNGGLITTSSTTTFQVSSGSGIIVSLNASLNDNPYPTIQYINWNNLSSSIAPLSASYDQSFIAIQATGSTGTIYMQGTPYNDGQYDTLIPIGNVIHQNRSTINATATYPSVAYGFKQRSNDFIKAFGPLKLSGLSTAVSASSTGSLIVTSGTAYSDGRNYTADPNNPSYVTDPGTTTSKIYRYYQSGSGWVYDTNGGAGYPTIDPTRYSNNGVLTAVPGTGANRRWSVQRVYYFPSGATKGIYVYYGNTTYATLVEATANIPYENFIEAPNTAAGAVLSAYLIVRNDADFTNAASYRIDQGGLFRNIGGAGGGGSAITQTLAGLSDVAISGPLNKQSLVYNNISTKWENTYSLSGSLIGNASTATTASYVATASYVTGSIFTNSNSAASASFAQTASYVALAQTASYVTTAQTASYVTLAQTASYVTTAQTASYILNAVSASFATTASYASQALLSTNVVGSANRILFNNGTNTTTTSNELTWTDGTNLLTLGTGTGAAGTISKLALYTSSYGGYGFGVSPAQLDYITDGSHVFYKNGVTPTELLRITSIGDVNIAGTLYATGSITGSLLGTASYATQALSASYATTASYLNTLNQDLTFNGNLTLNGTASITYLNVAYESSSIIYSSGSNQFGDATNDTQTLIGRVIVSGSLEVTGSANIPSITGSLLGTASYAIQALTASYIETAQTASYVLQAVSASFATTSSYITIAQTASYVTLAQTASYVLQAVSASYATTASYVTTAQTASYVTAAQTASYVLNAISSSLAQTASYVTTAQTASYILQAVSASYATTASYYGGTVTTAATASYSTNFTVASTLIIDQTLTDYATVASTIVGANNLFTQVTGSYRSAFGKYTLFKGTNARSGEFISVLNDTNVRYSDSSTTDIGDTTDIVFSSSVVGSDLQINATAGSSGWTVRMLTTYL